MNTKEVVVGLSCLVLLLPGCARLDYQKVPSPTQYSQWTDELQRKADAMKGVRYYLPRPFVHLKQSVPVAQRVALVTFNFDTNSGQYLLELPPHAPAWVSRVTPRKMSVLEAWAAHGAGADSGKAGNFQTEKLGGPTNTAATPAPETPAQTLNASTGYINETDPVTKLSALMDVVYLPDFEEQYVIRPHAGFAGQAEIETRLRNGWAAETFKQKIDYSQIAPYIIRNVEKASDTAAKIATTWLPTATLGLPPNTSLADVMKFLAKGPGGLQSVRWNAQDAKDFLSQSLIFKIAEVRVAQPGLYPILKERELRRLLPSSDRQGPVLDPEFEFETFLQQANVPWIRPDMAFVPCPPVTVVGFNTTVDVFLSPATERINFASSYDSGEETPSKQADAFKKPMKDALVAALPTAVPEEVKSVGEQNLVIDPLPNGNVQITLKAAQGKTFKNENLAAYQDWIRSALKTRADVSFKTLTEPFDTLIATVLAPPSEIVKGLNRP